MHGLRLPSQFGISEKNNPHPASLENIKFAFHSLFALIYMRVGIISSKLCNCDEFIPDASLIVTRG